MLRILGENFFSWCKSLYEVVFEPDSKLKEIDDYTFSYSGMKTIRIRKSTRNTQD
jgi:hypothetical protein